MYPPKNKRASVYERAYDKVYGKMSTRYISKTEMEVLQKEFYDQKNIIMERILLIEIIQNELHSSMNAINDGGDETTLYTLDYEEIIREHILAAMDEWNEMNRLYNREAGQRKSKISESDLEVHHVLLLEVRDHIYATNDEDLTGIPNNLGTVDKNLKSAESSLPSIVDTTNNNEINGNLETPKESKHKKGKIVGPKSKAVEKYDRKETDEKIKRMQEKIARLKATAIEQAELANLQNDIIKVSTHSEKIGFEISGSNKKLMALNEALSLKQGEMKNEKMDREERLDAASNKLEECIDNL